MSRPTKKLSPYLDLLEPGENVTGQRGYDPKQLYQYLFDNVDRNMVLLYTQRELAEAIEMSREALNYFMVDIADLGWLEKEGKKWRMVKTPNEIEWNKETYNKLLMLKRWHQPYYRKQYEAEGITKGDIING